MKGRLIHGSDPVGPQARREYLARMRERYERAGREGKAGSWTRCASDGLSPQSGDSVAAAAGAGRAAAAARAAGAVRAGGGAGVARDLDGGGVSVVGPAEGVAAGVAAVGAPAAATDRRRLNERSGKSVRGRWIGGCSRYKRELRRRQYGRTKPGTLLKHHIPLQTERWNVTAPGFTEIDLVAHSGDCADGEFLHSLNVTDIHTTWVETRAVLGKSQVRVREALETICAGAAICVARHRFGQRVRIHQRPLVSLLPGAADSVHARAPYKKDDNAHIEQKNWTHVRKLVGYDRYDSPAALDGDQRGVCGSAPAPESVAAVGQAAARRRAWAAGCAAGMTRRRRRSSGSRACPDGGSRQGRRPRAAAAHARSVRSGGAHRSQRDRLYALANHRRGSRPMDAANLWKTPRPRVPQGPWKTPRTGFPQRPQALIVLLRRRKTKKTPVTQLMAR